MTLLEMQDIFHIFSEKLKIFLHGTGKNKKTLFFEEYSAFLDVVDKFNDAFKS